MDRRELAVTTNGCPKPFDDQQQILFPLSISTSTDLANFINQNPKIKFIDCCFSDCLGQWHHTTYTPKMFCCVSSIEKGFSFDGSSISMFTTIVTSDLVMKPDPTTCWMDPFATIPTLHVTCDVLSPNNQRHPFCPRGILERTDSLFKKFGFADEIKIGPELEMFIFDGIRVSNRPGKISVELDSFSEGSWSDDSNCRPNMGHRHQAKGYYMPVPPVDSLMEVRSAMLSTIGELGISIEKHHHEVATSQCELGITFGEAKTIADQVMTCKYTAKNVAHQHGKTATFMAKPLVGDNGSGMHCNLSIWKNGKNLFFSSTGSYWKISNLAKHFIAGILHHAPALLAITNPTVNSYRRLLRGFEAPSDLVYSAGNRSAAIRIPVTECDNETTKRIECRFPDATGSPYLMFAAIILAGFDGLVHDMEPPVPMDKNIYNLTDEERAAVGKTPVSLWDALDALEKDHEWLRLGECFPSNFVEIYVKVKRAECLAVLGTPHPKDFQLYYSC